MVTIGIDTGFETILLRPNKIRFIPGATIEGLDTLIIKCMGYRIVLTGTHVNHVQSHIEEGMFNKEESIVELYAKDCLAVLSTTDNRYNMRRMIRDIKVYKKGKKLWQNM